MVPNDVTPRSFLSPFYSHTYPKYANFITKYFQKREDFKNGIDFFSKKLRRKAFFRLKKIPKTQGKTSKLKGEKTKLKENTQALGVLILALAPN